MLIHVRPIAIGVAVVFFFGLSFVGYFSGLAPIVCCKRACLGAALAYIATALAMRIINAILASAIIEHHIARRKE